MNVPPQIIKVKRRRDEDPVQALVVNKKIRGPTDKGRGGSSSSSSWLSSASTIYRLQRTEGRGGEVETTPDEIRLGIPVVRATAPPAVQATPAPAPSTATTTTTHLTVKTPGISSATPTKRKGPPESPLSLTPAPVVVPGIDHTPPTPNATQTTIPTTTSTTSTTTTTASTRHGHPPGSKESSNLLQVPQPRKYHLAHRISHKRAPVAGSLVRRGGDSPKKSAVFIEGDGARVGVVAVGGAAAAHREKKRRREKKAEFRTLEESLNEQALEAETKTQTPPSTRKRPNVNPQEKKQNEERKKKLLGQVDTTEEPDNGTMDVDVPKVTQQTKPIQSSRGKDAHRHPTRDNIDNGDDELSKQLQAMVLDYLNDQEGITNLPTTAPATARKKPLSKTQQMIGGGVGGGSWEKIDRKMVRSGSARSEESGSGITGTDDESEVSDNDWVYDVYVREKVDETKKLVGTVGPTAASSNVVATSGSTDSISPLAQMKPGEYGVLVISNSDDEEWFYEGGWDDDDKSEDEGLSDDEDSNAEDYRTNDYPDEEEVDDEFFAGGDNHNEEDEDEYIIDDEDEIAAYLYGGLTGRSGAGGGLIRSDDEGDSESETYEKVYNRSRWGRAGRGGGGAGRRRYPPGEEEYDLADEFDGSGYDDDYDGDGDDASYQRGSVKIRRRLERGVWGVGTAVGGVGGRGEVMMDEDEDSDEEMK